jgi:hypothetical protein
MPFGFLGTAVLLALVGAGLPIAYAFVWPTILSRIGLFLSLAIIVGLIAAAIALYWLLLPLQTVGISGVEPGATNVPNSLDELLKGRFFIALVVLLAFQLLLCKVMQVFVSR